MGRNGQEIEDDGTIEVEIDDGDEDDDDFLVEEGDILEFQSELIEDLQEMIVKCVGEQRTVLEEAKRIVEYYHKFKSDAADEFRRFLRCFSRKLAGSNQRAKWETNEFRKTLREVLVLYVEVNSRMKVEEKGVIKQDAFISQLDKNEKELAELRENLKNLQQELIGTVPSTPALPSTTNMSAETISEANHIDQPFKPIETEIATHVICVNKAMDDLKRNAPKCANLPKLMNKVKDQGAKVAKLALEENPAKTVTDFVNTLTPKQRD